MKRRRYVPLSVRVKVAERQMEAAFGMLPSESGSYAARLASALWHLSSGGTKKLELHHRPALVNRPLNSRGTDTVPPANDPAHLVYLLKDEEHRIETYVRGVGAQRSDVSQRRYLKNVERNRKPKRQRPKKRWASRRLRSANRWPPKGSRKIQNRRKRT